MKAKMIGPPDKLRIPYEEWEGDRFHHVGRCADGRQFLGFVTGAFRDGYDWQRVRDPNNNDWQRDKAWLAVLHVFDNEGNHLGSEVRLGGYDCEGWEVAIMFHPPWDSGEYSTQPSLAPRGGWFDMWFPTRGSRPWLLTVAPLGPEE